jgi:hypothetical protein
MVIFDKTENKGEREKKIKAINSDSLHMHIYYSGQFI